MKRSALVVILILFMAKSYGQSATNDSLKFSSHKKEITTFFKLLDTAGLRSIFSGRPITILAPDDNAFEKSPIPDSLFKPANKTAFLSLLNNHIIAGMFTVDDISAGIKKGKGLAEFTALSGKKYTVGIDGNRNLAIVDGAGVKHIVKVFDMRYGSATIFIIDSVITTKE